MADSGERVKGLNTRQSVISGTQQEDTGIAANPFNLFTSLRAKAGFKTPVYMAKGGDSRMQHWPESHPWVQEFSPLFIVRSTCLHSLLFDSG